jgi:hypothetical protein
MITVAELIRYRMAHEPDICRNHSIVIPARTRELSLIA